jgi:hypothetical protein
MSQRARVQVCAPGTNICKQSTTWARTIPPPSNWAGSCGYQDGDVACLGFAVALRGDAVERLAEERGAPLR